MEGWSTGGPPGLTSATPFFRLLDLPREIIRLICLHVYDPLSLSQQDRLTWGIFSTVDMDNRRQADLASLIRFGWVSRKIRREARVVLFRCIRVNELRHLHWVVAQKDNWGKYVRSIIIDLNMFDPDPDLPSHFSSPSLTSAALLANDQPIYPRRPRSCWVESALLVELVRALPSLAHMCIFADASDDSALALFFSSLILHPSLHIPPPSTRPTTPRILPSTRTRTASSGISYIYPSASPPPDPAPLPISTRLTSFGWRQRAPPPTGFRQYAQVSTFVSTLHLIGHSYRLSTLVLDADMDEMDPEDILTVCRELRLRPSPTGENSELVSLTLCGPIRGWDGGPNGNGILSKMVREYNGFRELFIDRPLRKSHEAHAATVDYFINLLQPLSHLPHLRLLQVGSYTWTYPAQLTIVQTMAQMTPSLLVVGLLNEHAQTSWWGIWRRASPPQTAPTTENEITWANEPSKPTSRSEDGMVVVPLGEGHLKMLEDEADAWERRLFDQPSLRTSVKRGREDIAPDDVDMDGTDEVVLPPSADEMSIISASGSSELHNGGSEGRMSLNRILSG